MTVQEKNGKVISIINMKGGVGKTTLTKEIGTFLSENRNHSVLLIDVDPQLNLTQALFKKYGFAQSKAIELASITESRKDTDSSDDNEDNPDSENNENKKKVELKISDATIERIFSATSSSPARTTETIQVLTDTLHLIPGELGIEFSLRNLNSGRLENGLFHYINGNNLRKKYDYILIDCPPTYSSYTVAALKPSDFFVVPVKAEEYSILGLDMLLKVVDYVVEENSIYFQDKPLYNLGVIFTDIANTPSRGTEKMLQSIKQSDEIRKRNVQFFSTYFLRNKYLKNKIDYTITNSKSELSFQNLSILVDELIGRIDSYER